MDEKEEIWGAAIGQGLIETFEETTHPKVVLAKVKWNQPGRQGRKTDTFS